MEVKPQARNPGPSWGYRFIRLVDRLVPESVLRILLWLGAGVGLCLMPRQRRHSKRFLAEALGRGATWRDSWKHFYAFAVFLVERFRVAQGREQTFRICDEREDRVETLAKSGQQALYGTFHFGQSDVMGFWLSRFGLSLRMVRTEVGNSDDLGWLHQRFGDSVGFIWVNNPSDMLFALKQAVDEGHSIAMKCDRVEHSSKRESFEFLGERRWFPFTIYHLSILFDLPVVFAFGLPGKEGVVDVYSSRCYWPDHGTKSDNLAAAKRHFEETLRLLESLVRQHPYQWFNFIESNPTVLEGAVEHARRA